MKTVIIDYGSGNLHSTVKSFEKAAENTGHEILLTSTADDLESATHIVLPGVGAFADCMGGLKKLPGMIAALENEVLNNKKPFLGICVGMQLLADNGFEHGEHKGLGWIKGKVTEIKPSDSSLKIPHMGWNNLEIKKSHPLMEGIKNGDHVYFVHSYHFECADKVDILATVDYGGTVTAAVAKNNIMGTQFHPEKSQAVGLRLIENFLRMR